MILRWDDKKKILQSACNMVRANMLYPAVFHPFELQRSFSSYKPNWNLILERRRVIHMVCFDEDQDNNIDIWSRSRRRGVHNTNSVVDFTQQDWCELKEKLILVRLQS